MMTVHEVSKISGVSIRALHHYDKIKLLPATEVTNAGYRLYDNAALEQQIHLLGLGAMYSGGGDFTTNIDKVGGEGTAVFADKAIQAYCRK